MNPFLKWMGGKKRILPQIKSFFPEKYENYYEVFLGGAAVFFSIENDNQKFVNDLNEEIINLYRVIKDNPYELMSQLDEYIKLYSKEFYYQLRNEKFDCEIKRASRILFLNKSCFNGLYRTRRDGSFNTPIGSPIKTFYEKENILGCSELLKKTEITNLDFEEVLSKTQKGDLVYCDPPYDPISSTSKFTTYNGKDFNKEDHKRLFNSCYQAYLRGAFIILSHSSTEFIKDLYKDFPIHTLEIQRNISFKKETRGKVEELIIVMNIDL